MAIENYTPQIWVHNPRSSLSRKYQSIVDVLQSHNIAFAYERPEKDHVVVLLIIEEDYDADQEKEIIQEILTQGLRIIALYIGAKPLPFHRSWELINMGVSDVLRLDNRQKLGEVIQAKIRRWSTVERIMHSRHVKETLLGGSLIWKNTLRQVVEIACFSSAPVLILGESGTGKELVSRLIHKLDKRPDKQELILLDCSSIVPELSGSEFFGHEKGAFTNAVSTREGAFALADRGTLFLDEIGELPKTLQAELLRVSQEGAYKRVGSNIWKKTAFRLVSATNRDLQKEIEKGQFRQDLYYRISTCVLRLPTLEQRQEDILELAEYFLKEILKTEAPPAIDRQVQHYLLTRKYPGNVRELKQVITRLAYRHCGKYPISIGDIPDADRASFLCGRNTWQANGFKSAIQQALVNGIGLKEIKKVAGDIAMDIAIEEAAGNLQEAAKRLDVSDRLVQGYLKEKGD